MDVITSISALRTCVQQWRLSGLSTALVPTMGNLHAGHIALVRKALAVADRVIVSIFVNPLQFSAGEDYQRYPRTLPADQAQLMQAGVHLLFTPTVTDLYPHGIEISTYVKVPQLSDILCGATRPGHFMGVATIVSKLFNLVQPDKALFGQKDYQQWLVIQRMVADLWMPITLLSVPTVREQDGLAMSSRNCYLNTQERAIAPHLFKTLNEIRSHLVAGQRNLQQLETQAFAQLATLGFKPDYVAIRNAIDLAVPTPTTHTWAVLTAAYLGQARLIDNICFDTL